ncbi:unnamed protein product [Vitrella brassicaformis CCMP3155]|uniref:Uncharacterized protein n=1 Tax=Vitrella brassicaformis (strain CCMP3155) TaxID=1169540 RepID=A0A0G4EDV5_VITBC|nr:unnamed protein product [Vitrella brassicaformis CCMP3155]|eukprot:CEL94140.1 unnamed protein product [Vitrella brassicaformis CCMP3155]
MRHHGIQILDAISVLISHASRLLHGFRDDPPFPDDAGRPGLSLSHTIAALVQGHAAALELKFTLDSHTGSHQPHLTRQLFSAGFRAMAFALRGLNHLAADHTAQPQGMMQKLWPRRQDKPKRMSLLQPVRGIFPPSRRWLRYVMATAPISSADAVHRHLSAVTRLNCKCPPFWLHPTVRGRLRHWSGAADDQEPDEEWQGDKEAAGRKRPGPSTSGTPLAVLWGAPTQPYHSSQAGVSTATAGCNRRVLAKAPLMRATTGRAADRRTVAAVRTRGLCIPGLVNGRSGDGGANGEMRTPMAFVQRAPAELPPDDCKESTPKIKWKDPLIGVHEYPAG